MSKILKIENGTVSIGNDDGTLTEVRMEDCNFNPNVGDEVNLFFAEDKTICIKAEAKKEENTNNLNQNDNTNNPAQNGGINIVLNQGSNNTNAPTGGFTQEQLTYAAMSGKRVVNKMTYGLFAILLGSIGVHKFLVGKAGMGILYILFCWTGIPSIVGLIEGIIALCKQEDANGNILI